ncbi:MAG: hypothetical protein PIR02_04700 [Microbacterium enclense]
MKRSTGNRGIDSMLHVEYQSTAGPFTVIYQHTVPTVGVGAEVWAGTQVGTVAAWGGNSHVHVSLIPGPYSSSTSNYGYRGCQSGKGANQGHVNPIPWLAANGPSESNVAEGAFVAYQNHVYRIAGGAPIYVGSWNAVGGERPAQALTDDQWNRLPRYPKDGTFLNSGATGAVFRVAGGAPVYVGSWDAVGGAQPVVTIDQAAIDNADGGAPWDHLRRYPADGTFLNSGATGAVFRVAGGAPVYVGSWDAVGGAQPVVTIDQAAIDNADGGAPWDHLRRYPADGTLVSSGATGEVFRVAGGAPLYVSSWDAVGGPQPAVTIDHAAIDNADGAAPWDHLRRYPADGTFLTTVAGQAYRVVGRAALPLGSWAAVGGVQPSTLIDGAAIARSGSPAPWNHLTSAPTDGSVVMTQPSAKSYRFSAGYWRLVARTPGAVVIGDATTFPSAVTPRTPTFSGSLRVGSVLTASAGEWKPAPVTVTFRWLRNGTPIPGATGKTYRLVAADAGTKIAVEVKGTAPGLRSVAVSSAGKSIATQAFSQAPRPVVSGKMAVGSTVKASVGTWSPAPTKLMFQWRRDGVTIPGATASSYKITTSDAGARLTMTVVGTKPGFTRTSRTSESRPVARR